jgi:hypothetical protein
MLLNLLLLIDPLPFLHYPPRPWSSFPSSSFTTYKPNKVPSVRRPNPVSIHVQLAAGMLKALTHRLYSVGLDGCDEKADRIKTEACNLRNNCPCLLPYIFYADSGEHTFLCSVRINK